MKNSTIPIGDCCEFIHNGMSIKQDKTSGGLPITRIETISNGTIDPNKLGYAGLNAGDIDPEKYLKCGDILISNINSVEHLGKTAIYEDKPVKLVHGMNLLCMRPKKELVDAKFMLYFTRSILFKKQLPRITNKSVNQASFSATNFKNKVFITFSTIEDQKCVVKILDEADTLRQKRKQAIVLLDNYLKSVFFDMFGDPVLNTKGWDVKPLSEFGDIITGNTPSRSDKDNYSPQFIEWIKTDNIVEGKTYITNASEYLSEKGFTKARSVKDGAVLTACIAGSVKSIGRSAVTNRKVSFNQQINAIQPNKLVNSHFLNYLLNLSGKYIRDHATSGMKKILTKGSFEKINFILPPIERQQDFADIFIKQEKLKNKMVSQSKELDNQFQVLMQRSFSSS